MNNRLEKLTVRAQMSAEDESVGNVFISGPITSWAWDDFNETDSLQVRRELEKVADAQTLNLFIDSPGGYLDEGMTMMRLIKEHKAAKKHAYCMECASAATLLCIPCDTVTAYEGAEFLFHMPRGGMSGTPDEIIGYGQGLQKRAQSVAELYSARMPGKTVDDILQMMKDETWMTPQEAMECGFVNDIEPIAPPSGITMSAERTREDEALLAKLIGYKPHSRSQAAQMRRDNGKNAPISGAGCNTDKEDKKSMTLEELKKSAPELVESIMQAGRKEGAAQERERMQALDRLMTEETKETIMQAKYGDQPRTAQEVSMEILEKMLAEKNGKKDAAKDKGAAYLQNRKNETKQMNAVQAGAAADNDDDDADVRSMARMMAEAQRAY